MGRGVFQLYRQRHYILEGVMNTSTEARPINSRRTVRTSGWEFNAYYGDGLWRFIGVSPDGEVQEMGYAPDTPDYDNVWLKHFLHFADRIAKG